MSLREWIAKNRNMIDATARRYGAPTCISDQERETWIRRTEWLYKTALKEGVNEEGSVA